MAAATIEQYINEIPEERKEGDSWLLYQMELHEVFN